MAELTDREERTLVDAVRRSVRSVRHRHAAGQESRVSRAPWRRPPHPAVGAEFSREHLRLQAARRRAHPLGQRRGQPERGIQAARHPGARSVLRSDRRADQHIFWPRAGCARRLCAPVVPSICRRSPPTPRRRSAATVHRGGTYVNMEGPQFSTLAESKLYRSWGMDVIGMTNLQEAKLAREAEICYATLALVTDYDCWHPDHDSVTVDLIIAQPAAERGDGAEGDRRSGRPHRRPRDAVNARPPWPRR